MHVSIFAADNLVTDDEIDRIEFMQGVVAYPTIDDRAQL